jgi:hypothetical protein
MPHDRPEEPWLSFLNALDATLTEPADLHCIGGFAIIEAYGSDTTTVDMDVLLPEVIEHRSLLAIAAGKGSELNRSHGVYLDMVSVASVPEDYQDRLVPLYPACWNHLRLFALDPHDLALTKLERNNGRDRRDVRYLAQSGRLDPEILRTRYYKELRPYVIGRESWHDQTLAFWLEAYFPTAEPA